MVTGAVAGSSGHMWNRVKIHDNWYNVDVTFDDDSNDNNSTNKYILSSNDFFYKKTAHPVPHSNLLIKDLDKSGSEFDNPNCVARGWSDNITQIRRHAVYNNGYWYYLSKQGKNMSIVKSDFKGTNKTILRQLSTYSSIANSDKIKFTQNKIYFIDIINSKYWVCSINYDGSDFSKGEQNLQFDKLQQCAYYQQITALQQ